MKLNDSTFSLQLPNLHCLAHYLFYSASFQANGTWFSQFSSVWRLKRKLLEAGFHFWFSLEIVIYCFWIIAHCHRVYTCIPKHTTVDTKGFDCFPIWHRYCIAWYLSDLDLLVTKFWFFLVYLCIISWSYEIFRCWGEVCFKVQF